MKKVISLVLALVMVMSMTTMVALADDPQVTTSGGTTNTTATYTKASGFTVTIPAATTIDATSKTATISVAASGVIIDSGKKLSVTMHAASFSSGKFYVDLSTNDDAVEYTIKNGETAVTTDNAEILAVAAGTASGSTTLNLALATGADSKKSGAHTDTITFTCSVVNATT